METVATVSHADVTLSDLSEDRNFVLVVSPFKVCTWTIRTTVVPLMMYLHCIYFRKQSILCTLCYFFIHYIYMFSSFSSFDQWPSDIILWLFFTLLTVAQTSNALREKTYVLKLHLMLMKHLI